MQWNYELTIKQNWLVCDLGTVPLFNRFWFWWKFSFGPEKLPGLSRNAPMSISRGNNLWCLYNVAWKGSKITIFVLFVSSGAETPVYVAMLPINAGKPQGEFLKDKVILEWETMSFRSHWIATDKDSIQEGRWVTVFTRLNASKIAQ